MSTNRYQEDDNVVTIAERKSLTPFLQNRTLESLLGVPDIVYFELPNGSFRAVDTRREIRIGRHSRPEDPPVTVDLEGYNGDKAVSRQHAMIMQLRGMLTLVDLSSINGTFINGEQAAPLKRYQIYDGDIIKLGRIEIKLHYYKP